MRRRGKNVLRVQIGFILRQGRVTEIAQWQSFVLFVSCAESPMFSPQKSQREIPDFTGVEIPQNLIALNFGELANYMGEG